MKLFIQESFVNLTEHHRFGDSEVYETHFESPSEVYKHALKEYGRCTGKMYIDRANGETIAIGWVFASRQTYEDHPKKTYLREAWISLHDAPPTETRTYQYHKIPG